MFRKDNEIFNYNIFVKRILDICVSFVAVVLLMPLFIILAIAVKIDSQGPIIYKQKRVGKDLIEFDVFKFRTMIVNADQIGPKSTQTNDSRITNLGKFMRKLSLDELPQLFNVLIGDMSIVGYRPGVFENYTKEELKCEIFVVKPGITGYAQVNGRSNLTVAEKRMWEMKYVQDISFLTDIKILVQTIKIVLLGIGSN